MTITMPEHLNDYITELADRFPDMADDEVFQASCDYFPGAVAYRSAILRQYDRIVKETS